MSAPVLPCDITGLVLAGGRGSRMGGADKGLVQWQGEALAARALRRLQPQVASVAINANRNLQLYGAWGAPVWPDADDSHAGPLAGLMAGLDRCPTPWLVTVPCDSPLFPRDLVRHMAAAVQQSGAPLAVAATRAAGQDVLQPVFLLVNRCLRPALAQALAQGEHRVGRWARAQGAATAVFEDASAFANANTAEELAALPPSD